MTSSSADNQDDIYQRDDYATDGQQIAVLCVGAFSSLLSLFGSISIIFIIIKNKKWKQPSVSSRRGGSDSSSSGLFHRLMLGLSVADCFVSLGLIMAPYLQPPDPLLLGASGTTASCSFIGVLLYVVITTASYNCCLSVFYYRTIRLGEKEQQLSEKYEKWMHVVSVGLTVVFNAVALALESYNPTESNRVCDLTPAPTDCDIDPNIECTRGLHTDAIGAVVLIILIFFALVGVTLTALVFIHVRRILNASQKYRYEDQSSENKRIQRLAVQAVLYCLAFINLFLWGLSSTIFEGQVPGETRSHLGRPEVFVFLLLQSFFFPLQGFVNFIIYIRPRYMSNLQRYKNNTAVFSFFRIYLEDDLDDSRFQKSSTASSSIKNKEDDSTNREVGVELHEVRNNDSVGERNNVDKKDEIFVQEEPHGETENQEQM